VASVLSLNRIFSVDEMHHQGGKSFVIVIAKGARNNRQPQYPNLTIAVAIDIAFLKVTLKASSETYLGKFSLTMTEPNFYVVDSSRPTSLDLSFVSETHNFGQVSQGSSD
jgi:hypothetical protein